MSEIRPMDPSSVQRIVAGQAVTDLASVVKELVDNALDAGASIINIRLFDQGASIIEVSDDGCGIPPDSRPNICMPHATSKLHVSANASSQDILSSISTLGFRGEALFSLANLSKTLMVATRTADEELAVKLEFQPDGTLRPNSTQQIPKKIGTTVAVVNFLHRVPVRRHDFVQRLKPQRIKLIRRMEAYFIFCPGISMHLMDMVGTDYFDSTERTLLQTNASSKTLQETVSSVLGPKVIASLCDLSVDLSSAFRETGSAAEEEDGKALAQENPSAAQPSLFRVLGLVSHANPSKKCTGVKDRQLFAIHRRPVEMPKLAKRLNHLWKTMTAAPVAGAASHVARPFIILHFELPPFAYDVNLEPDKRKVVLENEDMIFHLIQERVAQLWSEHTDGKFPVGLAAKASNSTAASGPSAAQRNEERDSDDDSHDEEEDDADEEEDEWDDASSPSRFTRRYAFVNDVRRMRLQHQYDDGRATSIPEQEEARKKQVLAELAEQGEDASDDEDENDEFQIATKQVSPTDAAIPASATANTDANHVTPHVEEHKEAEFIDKRSSGISESISLSSALSRRMTPSELRRSRMMQQSSHEFPDESGDRAFNAFNSYRSDADGNQSIQHGLERFGFSSMRGAQTVSDHSLSEKDFATKRPVLSAAEESESKRPRRTAMGMTNVVMESNDLVTRARDDHAEDKADQRRVSLERGRSPPSSTGNDDDDDEDSVAPAFPDQERGMNGRTSSSIVFTSFTGTDDAVLQSRRERLAMRDRRLGYNYDTATDEPVLQSDIVSLSKEDFSSMRVIGQFNLGFILAVSKDSNLWILDQHACDEKFNFEKLMAETVISEQRLISPMPLELMPAEESCIIDNMGIFEKNGFRFQVDWDKPPRHRLSLTALPHSGAPDGRKAVQFGKEDVSALCHILGVDESSSSHDAAAGGGTGTDGSGLYGNNAVRRYTAGSNRLDPTEKIIARLPKAIAMFASRACRGSIMIGQALSQKDMDRIVKRLKDVEHPWNCPHGRPTMRHVLALESLLRGDDQKARELIGDTAATMMSQEEIACDHEDQRKLDMATA